LEAPKKCCIATNARVASHFHKKKSEGSYPRVITSHIASPSVSTRTKSALSCLLVYCHEYKKAVSTYYSVLEYPLKQFVMYVSHGQPDGYWPALEGPCRLFALHWLEKTAVPRIFKHCSPIRCVLGVHGRGSNLVDAGGGLFVSSLLVAFVAYACGEKLGSHLENWLLINAFLSLDIG